MVNRITSLEGYGQYYRDSHASTGLAIADAMRSNSYLKECELKQKFGVVGTAQIIPLLDNEKRFWIQIQNLSDENFLYVNFGTQVTASNCMKLLPNKIWESENTLLINKAIHLLSNQSGTNYCVMYAVKE